MAFGQTLLACVWLSRLFRKLRRGDDGRFLSLSFVVIGLTQDVAKAAVRRKSSTLSGLFRNQRRGDDGRFFEVIYLVQEATEVVRHRIPTLSDLFRKLRRGDGRQTFVVIGLAQEVAMPAVRHRIPRYRVCSGT